MDALKDFFFKYILRVDTICFIVFLGVCIFIYFKYDRHRIQLSKKSFLDTIKTSFTPDKKPKKKKIWKHEEECRKIFERLFKNHKFPSVRPDFLKNPVTGHNLELDGYCKELNLAFEYDGRQHSEYNRFHHRHGHKEFIYQVTKDDYKTKKCKKEGIDLIRIPYYIHFMNLESYIIRELKRIKRLPTNNQ